MIVTNSAESGSDGTVVTTANSGGVNNDTAWDTVTIGANTNITFSAAQAAHGSLSYFFTSTSTNSAYLIWTGGALTTMKGPKAYCRAYFYFNPGSAMIQNLFFLGNGSAQVCGAVGTASNLFRIRDSSNTVIMTSSTAVPFGQWIRLEMMVSSDASVGQIEVRIFTDPDSNTPTETMTTPATVNTRGGDIQTLPVGLPSGVVGASFYVDEIALQDIGYPGPVSGANLGWYV